MGNTYTTEVKGGFIGSKTVLDALKNDEKYNSLFLYYLSIFSTLMSSHSISIKNRDFDLYKTIVEKNSRNLEDRLKTYQTNIVNTLSSNFLANESVDVPVDGSCRKLTQLASSTAIADYNNNLTFTGLAAQDTYNPLENYCKLLDTSLAENKTVYDNTIVAWGAGGELVQIIPPQPETFKALDKKNNLVFAYDNFDENFGVSGVTHTAYSIKNLVNHLSHKYTYKYGNIDKVSVQFIYAEDYKSVLNRLILEHMGNLQDDADYNKSKFVKLVARPNGDNLVLIEDLNEFYEEVKSEFKVFAEKITKLELSVEVVLESDRNGSNVDAFVTACDNTILSYMEEKKQNDEDINFDNLYGQYIKLSFDSETTISIALIKQDLYVQDIKILTDIILQNYSKNNILLCSVRAVDCACAYLDLFKSDKDNFSNKYNTIHVAHGTESKGYIHTISGNDFVGFISNKINQLKKDNCGDIILKGDGIDPEFLQKFTESAQ